MNIRSERTLAAIAAMLAMAVAGSAGATNGYLTHGVGTKSKALAGSGIADPQEVGVVATNPAGIAFVDERLELGLAMFSPKREYETSASQLNGQFGSFTIGPNSISSKNELFFIPYVARNWKRGEQDNIALSFYARGGMNTEWRGGTATFDPDGPGPAPIMTFPGTYGGGALGNKGTAGVDLMQGFLNLAYARTDAARTMSLGAAAIVGIQRFRVIGVGTFAPYTKTYAESVFSGGPPVNPENLSNNGYDMSYGYGGSLGFQWNPTDRFSVAVGYTSEIKMSRFDKYSDLFAERGGFDVPAHLDAGVAFKATPRVTISADVQWIYYEGIPSVSNSIAGLFTNCPTANPDASPTAENFEHCLGGKTGGGFGWQDMTVYKAGVAWKYGEDWTFRVGASTTDQPIPSSEMSFNILAPGVMEEHYTVGFTRNLSGGREFSMSLMYAPAIKHHMLVGPQNFDPTQTVRYKMDQWDLEFSYAWGR